MEIAKPLLAAGRSVIVLSRDRGRQIERCPPGCELEVADVEDRYALLDVFRRHRPGSFVHCAANKYVDICERRPDRALGCNVLGLQNVLAAAEVCAVEAGVLVSSDKACDQTIYGMTKLLGERLVSCAAARTGARLVSVRLGNLIGSSGSVAALFRKAHETRSPVQVHVASGRAAKRFGMLPQKAAACVMEALGPQTPGAVLVWQMPVIDMRTLAGCLAPDCPVQEIQVSAELCQQKAITRRESPYVRIDDARIDGRQFTLDYSTTPTTGAAWEYSTNTIESLSEIETYIWLRSIITPPVDKAHKVFG